METTEHFLLRVLGFLVHEADFADTYLPAVPQSMFSEYPLMERAVAALRHYRQEYEAHPEAIDLLDVCVHRPFGGYSPLRQEDEEFDGVVNLFFEIHQDFAPEQRKMVEKRLEDEVRRAMALSALREAAEAVRSEDFRPADIRATIVRLERAEGFGIVRAEMSSVAHDLAARWKRRERELATVPRVPSGFAALDGSLRGGVPPQSLCVLIARTGVGKTMGLIHVAKHAMLYGFRVLFVTLEVSREEIEDRFDATLTHQSKGRLLEFRRDVEATRAAWRPRADEDILVVSAEPNAYGCADLDMEIERLRRERNWNPDVVCVDYADHLLPANRYKERRFELEGVYYDLKAIAKRGPRVVWTASQSNRKGATEKLITTLHMAEADVKGQVADVVVSMNQSSSERSAGIFHFYIAKNRLGKGNENAGTLEQDMDTATLVKGSATYLTKLPLAPGAVAREEPVLAQPALPPPQQDEFEAG